MNFGIITARIVSKPVRFSSFDRYYTEMHIIFLHAKNYFAHAIVLSDGEIGETVFDIYRRGDYLLIEGEMLSTEDIYQNKTLVIYTTEVNPAYLIMPT